MCRLCCGKRSITAHDCRALFPFATNGPTKKPSLALGMPSAASGSGRKPSPDPFLATAACRHRRILDIAAGKNPLGSGRPSSDTPESLLASDPLKLGIMDPPRSRVSRPHVDRFTRTSL
ncbi:hypothetical protein HDN1F_35410 [gamma proteobacterium HdN1]|nr:Hypothetical protein HDN1F_17780 [gamma proteobacterium HdN1]CBL47124.1 hypothetical protein HDN1F_35410 [gamma proteobacterium HdN1]